VTRRKLFPLLLLVLAALLADARPASACSCGRQQSVLDSYEWADVVVIVRAVAVEKAEPEKIAPKGQMSNGENYVDGVKSTSMRVEQVFKGGLRVGDEMTFAQGGGADCIWTFDEESVGQKYLFYLKRLKGSTVWIAGTCGRSKSVEYAGDDLLYLEKMEKVRGHTRISGTLSFSFLREAGESVAGRKIRIVGAGHTYEVKTDENGVYEIYDVPAGRYTVEPEIPRGWKVDNFWLSYSPSFAGSDRAKSPKQIPIVVADKRHAGLDLRFEVDNAVRGHVYDPSGRPMKDVCLHLVPPDGTKGPYLADCTEQGGAFEIDEIPPGRYVLVVNDDGKVTSNEPFGTFYYPNVPRREDATVFQIGLGEFVEDIQIYAPVTAATVTVEGVFLYSDGKPVADERVEFRSEKTGDKGDPDAHAPTDSQGRFSLKILKGQRGQLYGTMLTFIGEFENCPKLDAVIRKMGGEDSVPEIKTAAVQINADRDLDGVALKYPFPSCKKAKIP
jgi:hypothetical protein